MFQQTTRHSSVLSEVDKAVKLWSWKERLSVPPSISSLLLHRQFVPGSEQGNTVEIRGNLLGSLKLKLGTCLQTDFGFMMLKEALLLH